MRVARFVPMLAVLLAFGCGLWAQEEGKSEAEEMDLQKPLEELEQKMRILERQREVEEEVAAAKAKDAATVSVGKDGFLLKSADGAYQLRIRALVQADSRFFGDDQTKPLTDTFVMRRVRPMLEGTVGQFFDFRVTPDFGEGKTVLFDAYLDWKFTPWIKLRAGKFKPPVGLERLQSASDLAFAERALPTNLVPTRDIGLQIHGDPMDGVISYALGVFNGVPDGGNTDADINDAKDTAARAFFLPFKRGASALRDLGIGLAASYGNEQGTIASTGLPTYKTPGLITFFSYRSDGTATGTTVADGRRRRLSPQAYWYVGRFGGMAEYVRSSQEVELGASAHDLETTAWQVTAMIALSDDRPTFRGITPKQPFDPAHGGWGAFEIVARVGALEVDPNAFPVFADPAASAQQANDRRIGFNWTMNRNAKLMLDFSRTSFRGGAPAGGDREDEKLLNSRLQISF